MQMYAKRQLRIGGAVAQLGNSHRSRLALSTDLAAGLRSNATNETNSLTPGTAPALFETSVRKGTTAPDRTGTNISWQKRAQLAPSYY